jgi:hypothetical protein
MELLREHERDSHSYDLADEGRGQGFVGREADGAFAGFVVFEIGFELCDDAAGIEGAVILRRAEPDEHFSAIAEGGELVADAFLGAGGGGVDVFAELFERGAFVCWQRSEVGIDGFGGRISASVSLHQRFYTGESRPDSKHASRACRWTALVIVYRNLS